MAVLSKIRERSVFLIIIIALALFSFVLSGIFDSNSPLFNKNVSDIGEVNGETISREEFAQEVEFYRSRSNNKPDQMMEVNNAWNSVVRQKIYATQLEKSGVVVGEKDIWDALVAQIKMQRSPMFLNDIGMFDEEKLKEYIANLKESSEDDQQSKAAWINWINYEKNIKSSLEQNTYNSLISAGLGSTLKDGERDYKYQNTNVNLSYVYVPFSSIEESDIDVKDSDIENYIKSHKDNFTAEASRDIEFVNFEIVATEEDEAAIRSELTDLINDKEEYSTAAKSKVNITGFSNATDMADFFSTNDSDIPFDANFYTENKLPSALSKEIFSKNIGEVFGPYKEAGFYKISKVTNIKQMPDSVKASHILIPFIGTATADATVTQTEGEAKIVADSILTVLTKDKSKFEEIAKEMSIDKASGAKGGDLGWFVYSTMIPEFRDYAFENKIGDMGVVKSQFGFHIIKIDEQKNQQKNVQIATFVRKIDPSEKTENQVFEKAETFASNLAEGKNFKELAEENTYKVNPVLALKALDYNIPNLGSQRQIVRWLFEENTNENDIKRFETDKGYVVVKLDKKKNKGLSASGSNVRQIVLDEKKAAIIENRSNGNSLEDIAKENNTTVKSSLAVTNASPVLPGDGRMPKIIGVVTSLEENKLTKNIVGEKGVIFAIVTKINSPSDLDNYNANKKNLDRKLKSRNLQIYNAIKDNSDIVDNRASFY